MPPEAGHGLALHASAVAIGGEGILIIGRSGAGKSTLAAGLVERSTRQRPVMAVGDDLILLRAGPDGEWEARPHPRIAGFIERRGLGIVATPFVAVAPVRALIDLDGATTRCAALAHLPVLSLAAVADASSRCRRVLGWTRGQRRGTANTRCGKSDIGRSISCIR
jgi:energy-coupling factor transporter ATP-binding protein EcfA2